MLKFKNKEPLKRTKGRRNKENINSRNDNILINDDAKKDRNKIKKIAVVSIVLSIAVFIALILTLTTTPKINISLEVKSNEKDTYTQKQSDNNKLVEQKSARKEESRSVASVAEIEPAPITSPRTGPREYSGNLSPVISPPIPPLTEIIKEVKKGVVMITSGNSLGSGFIISPNGDIITNSHVVGENSEVRIKLFSGKSYIGRVLKKGVPPLDITLLKINIADHKNYLTLNNHSPCQEGAEVLAIGQPKGLEYTVTKGIVSNCNVIDPNFYEIKYIQTDTAINPGNSGGPLINKQGEVLGINTLILSNSKSIGFAIEIDTVRDFIQNKLTKLEANLQKIEKERRQNSLKELVLYFHDVWNLELINYMKTTHQRLEMEKKRGGHFNFRERYNAMIEEKKRPPSDSGFIYLEEWFEALAALVITDELTVDQTSETIKKHLY